MFHLVRRLGEAAFAEIHQPGEMQRIRLGGRHRQDAAQQPLGFVQPPGLLIFVGDAPHLPQRQRHQRPALRRLASRAAHTL